MFAVCAGTSAYANNVTIFNITNCPYRVAFNSGIPPLTVAPMQTLTVNSGTFDATGAKVSWSGLPDASIYAIFPTHTYDNSSTIGVYPPCIPGSGPYQISWAQANATANATLIIFP